MKKKHREILQQLMTYASKLGGNLDGTSTHESKYKDRQKAHMLTYKIILGILSDHPENDQQAFDLQQAMQALAEMKALTEKKYLDRNGNY